MDQHERQTVVETCNRLQGTPGMDAIAAARHDLAPSTVARIRETAGVYTVKQPELHEAVIPEHEMSFYLGLVVGQYQVEKRNWHNTAIPYVSVTTSERKGNRHSELLERTIATRGVTRTTNTQFIVLLHSPTFDPLLEPAKTLTSSYLRAKGRLAPFFLGFLAARLEGNAATARLGLSDSHLLQLIQTSFESNFGPGMLRLHIRNGNSSAALVIPDCGKVFAALLSTKAVQALPFLRELASLGNAQQEVSRPASPGEVSEIVVFERPHDTLEEELLRHKNENGAEAEERQLAAIRTLIGDLPLNDPGVRRIALQLARPEIDGQTADETTRREAIDALANGLPKDDPDVQEVLWRLGAERPRR